MNARVQSIKTLVARTVKDNLKKTIKSLSTSANDVWLYRTIVVVLGVIVLACIAGAVALSMGGKPVPEFLVALGSAAVGGMAGLLTPTPKQKQE